jgi:hypothetical protein
VEKKYYSMNIDQLMRKINNVDEKGEEEVV